MKIHELYNILQGMVNIKGIPHIIVVHCGANDILSYSCGKLLYYMKVAFITMICNVAPGSAIVFSEMLPRLNWRYSFNDILVERTRRRINRGVRSYLLKRRCYIIKHPDFDDKYKGMFAEDGVHLSFIGNDIFLNTLQGALETCLTKPWKSVYTY